MAVSGTIDLQHRQPGGTGTGDIQPGKAARLPGEQASLNAGCSPAVPVDAAAAHQLERHSRPTDYLEVVLMSRCVQAGRCLGERTAKGPNQPAIRARLHVLA